MADDIIASSLEKHPVARTLLGILAPHFENPTPAPSPNSRFLESWQVSG
jgi:hypothetical protein